MQTNSYRYLLLARRACLLVTTLLGLLVASANAQTLVTDGTTPLALTPGAPAGSYPLGDFENINYFNGSLNFHLPLKALAGRGEAGYTMQLSIEQHWTVFREHNTPHYNWWETILPGYGPGVLLARSAATVCKDTSNLSNEVETSNTRLTFTEPNGTEHELRDQLHQGQPLGFLCANRVAGSRGAVFTSVAGEALTFNSDTTIQDSAFGSGVFVVSGYLLFPNGEKYRIDAGKVTWIRDRNGNKISFVYGGNSVTSITDSLNRQVTIAYGVNDGAPYGVCDRITFKGFGGAARTIRVSRGNLDTALRAGFTIETDQQLFPEGLPAYTFTNDPPVATAVWLPNGRSYQFLYNSYGELARVVLPTGGAYEYDYSGGEGASPSGVLKSTLFNCPNSRFSNFYCYDIYRRIIERRIYPAGGSGSTYSGRDTYSLPIATYSTNGNHYIEVDHLDPAGAILAAERHYYNGTAEGSFQQAYFSSPTGYESWQTGKEVRTEQVAAGGGATVLRRIDDTWQLRAASSWSSSVGYDPHITQTISTLVDTNQVSEQTFSYDQFDSKTDTYEYGYGAGAAGALVRRQHTDYLVTNAVNGQDYTTTSIHVRRLPSQQQVFDAVGAEKSRITYEYDNYASDANHAPLVARAGISGLDAGYTTGYTTRGNATRVGRWVLSTSTPLYGYAQYDVAGNSVKKIDPLGHAATFDFSDRYGSPDGEARSNTAPPELSGQTSYAFSTLFTNALGQTIYTQFDYYLGRPVDQEDANGIVASASYNEALDRPSQMIRAANTAGKSQSTFSYDDTNRVISTWSDLTAYGDNVLKKATVYDGIGRGVQTRLDSDPTGVTYVDTTYDALGRVHTQSNPHRSGVSPTDGTTNYFYDGLGRTCLVAPPDGTLPTGGTCPTTQPTNDIFTTFSGNCTTATDQAGKSRTSCADGLGRLTQVFEDPGSSPHLNYETDYAYDALNNLLTVNQKGGTTDSTQWRTRTFVYDSLSRLTSSTNPESNIQPVSPFTVVPTTFAYDPLGNLSNKTSPAPNQSGTTTVTLSYCYDALNRLTAKAYTLQSCPMSSPVATYFYDQTSCNGLTIANGIGHRTCMTDAAGLEAWSYDITANVGWKITDARTTNGVPKSTVVQNNLAGSAATLTYPSGRIITYAFDAAARPISAIDSIGPINYATGALYAPTGALASLTNGASVVSTLYYDKRLQPCRISVKYSGTALNSCADTAIGNVLDFNYNFSLGTADNGNVTGFTNNRDTTRSQSFIYDPVNRISTAKTTSTSGGTCWDEAFGYDPWGNLLTIGRISGYACSNEELLNAMATAQNRISGDTYDTAGNVTAIPSIATYTYDAENHLTTTNAGVTYTYDGDGKRVQKSNGKLYWYGMSSDPLDETDLTGSITNPSFNEYVFFGGKRIARRDYQNNVSYYFADHLGTARVSTNAGGTICYDADFYPFGGERILTDTCDSAYKFTGKERDSESGLDDFGLRYFGSTLGRFMSPDSIANDWELANPQTWNRYAYARNNPLAYVDPDGAAVELICTGGNADQCAAQRQAALETLQNGVGNKQAADSLYINEVKDGDNTRYFVGIKGDVGDFENLSSGSKDLGELVGAKQVVEFGLTDKDLPGAGKGQGSYTYAPGEIGNANPRVLVNPSAVASASVFFSDTVFGSSRFGPGKIRDTTTGIAAFHEFGHAWKMWQNINAAGNGVIPGASGIDPRLNTSSEALRWENRMRQQVYGPTGPNNAERKVHD